MTTLVGGAEIEVTHLGPESFDEATLQRLEKFRPLLGTVERVKVRQVLVSQMQRYGNAILVNDEAGTIEIYTGKEPGWADTLTQESVNAVADKGMEINLDFFGAWYARQAKWKDQRTGGALDELTKKLAELERTMLTASHSQSSAGSSPSTTG